MSNQISQILSMFFLALLIIFSGEVISYQVMYARSLNETEQVAIYIQKNGTNDLDSYMSANTYFDSYSCSSTTNGSYVIYTLKTSKTYMPFSSIYKFLDNDISLEMKITRKE